MPALYRDWANVHMYITYAVPLSLLYPHNTGIVSDLSREFRVKLDEMLKLYLSVGFSLNFSHSKQG